MPVLLLVIFPPVLSKVTVLPWSTTCPTEMIALLIFVAGGATSNRPLIVMPPAVRMPRVAEPSLMKPWPVGPGSNNGTRRT